MPGLQLTRETVICVQPAGVTESKMTNNSCGEVKQCSERKKQEEERQDRVGGKGRWRKCKRGGKEKEEEDVSMSEGCWRITGGSLRSDH